METRIVLRREVQYLFSSDFKKLEIKRSVNVDLAAMNKTIVPPPRKPEHGILHPTAKHDIPPSLYKQSISSHILSTSKSHALHESNPKSYHSNELFGSNGVFVCVDSKVSSSLLLVLLFLHKAVPTRLCAFSPIFCRRS